VDVQRAIHQQEHNDVCAPDHVTHHSATSPLPTKAKRVMSKAGRGTT
jgi:hypothetical protein